MYIQQPTELRIDNGCIRTLNDPFVLKLIVRYGKPSNDISCFVMIMMHGNAYFMRSILQDFCLN